MKISLNVGGWDRIGRLILGVVLIALAYFGILTGAVAIVAYIVAAIALATGLIRFCPINAALGLNTCKEKSSKSAD
jgi:hypothetical protein